MPIQGLTNYNTFYSAVFHKGGRKPEKGYGFGKDLNNFFRVELKDINLKYSLLDSGIKKLPSKLNTLDGEVFTNSVDNFDYYQEAFSIFLLDSDIDKTFKTSMQLWDKTGLVQECDRQLIYKERKEYEDRYGHNRSRLFDCQNPCPMSSDPLGVPCVKGCQASGTLLFYLTPFLDQGSWRECKLDVRSFYDIQAIINDLQAIESQFGSIRQAPLGFPGYKGMIPLILKRVKINIKKPILDTTDKVQQGAGSKPVPRRTGKKADSSMWVIAIEVNPDWAKSYYAWKQCQEVILLGYSPQAHLVRQLPGVEISEKSLEPTPTVPDLPEPVEVLGDKEWEAIASMFNKKKQHPEWESKEKFCESLRLIYGCKLKELPLSEFQNILDHLTTKSLEVQVVEGARDDLGF